MGVEIDGPLGIINPSYDETWVNPIVGAQYGYRFTDRLGLFVLGDVGGFGVESDLTLHAMAMLQYRFTDWFAGSVGYRYLMVDYDTSEFVFHAEFEGAILNGFGENANPPGSLTGIPPERMQAAMAEIQAR